MPFQTDISLVRKFQSKLILAGTSSDDSVNDVESSATSWSVTLLPSWSMGSVGGSWPRLFEELADRFPELVTVLGEVSDRTYGNRPEWLLGLYERYLATGSPWDRRRLVRAGCVPPPAGPPASSRPTPHAV